MFVVDDAPRTVSKVYRPKKQTRSSFGRLVAAVRFPSDHLILYIIRALPLAMYYTRRTRSTARPPVVLPSVQYTYGQLTTTRVTRRDYNYIIFQTTRLKEVTDQIRKRRPSMTYKYSILNIFRPRRARGTWRASIFGV